ncbi:MAG: hypothetical protein ABJF23_08300 [Bryobacteraceae bacterium]
MTEIRFITCSTKPDMTGDDALAAVALRKHGIEAIAEPWDIPSQSEHPAVLRSPWNYHLKPSEFLAWIGNQQRPMWNSADTVRWNHDKFYLRELQQRGCPVIPTVFLKRGEEAHLPSILAGQGWSAAVVKPSISATAHLTSIATADNVSALVREHSVLVQKFMPEIQSHGELSLFFFNGVFSHASQKNAAPGDFRVQEEFGGRTSGTTVSAGLIDQAAAALSLTPGTPHLYARVDGILSGTIFFIMEIELIEPCLYLATDPKAPARFAGAVAARLQV